nr:MAG TPA: hypothetical protein [Caudoviricetes sp.]
MMTNDENEFMQDVINQASNKVELLQKTVIEKAVEIERLKAEFKQLETNAEILARGVRDLNHENYELTEKIKQAQIEEIAKFDKLCYDYNKLLYIIRCNMTSITRYIRNENEAYDIRYKELAETAVENILKAINHRGEE